MDPKYTDKFEAFEARLQELSVAVSQPDIMADLPRWQSLLRERSALEQKVQDYHACLAAEKGLEEAKLLLEDPDMADLAREEISALEQEERRLAALLRAHLLPPDPNDDRNVILEVRAGTGGDEACLFAQDLLRMYGRMADRHGLKMSLTSVSDTELGGIKEAVAEITGTGAWRLFRYESGVHQVKRVPVTESKGRTQTSTATVAVLPEIEDTVIDIRPEDLRIDTYRASGHGGQYINRTDSAVRITHLPTGTVATCQDEKSQLRNKERAMKVLISRIYEKQREEQDAGYAQDRRSQVGTGERSERIRTYHFIQGRVTDHRIGMTLYRIDDIMNGDLDEIIEALTLADQTEKLKAIGC